MLANGSIVSGYRVERMLGSGGMGTVYLVANPELPRREALKVLSAELSRDAGFQARFLREAAVAARLEHPNIVAVYRRGQTHDGQLWIAMQFVDGVDADAALQRGQMTVGRAVHIVGEVAKALDHAHQHQVIHRDVKPANFLLSGQVGPGERVLLGDFGIARALDDASVTGTGQVMATLAYAAPEVFSGNPIDGRADLYSLGCALYRMLTGTTPFAANGAAAVMMAHLMQPPPRVTERAPWLPSALDDVIATAMAKDPAHRFASGAELASAATAALYERSGRADTAVHVTPSSPPPPPPPQPQPVPRGRRRPILIGSLVAAVALIAGVVVAVGNWTSDRPTPTPSPPTASTTSVAPSTAPPPPVAAAALPGLLLSTGELTDIMGAPMQVASTLDLLPDQSQKISDRDCLSAFSTSQSADYRDAGWFAVQLQATQPAADFVAQGVVAFNSVADAQNLYDRRPGQWLHCEHRTITADMPDGQEIWTFGQSGVQAAILTITATRKSDSRTCGRAMTVRANVVIDVAACKDSGYTTQAIDVATKIAAKVLR
jgi:eukaryotic-like serine/threonine-protein kinase